MIDNATEIRTSANIEAVIREYYPNLELIKAGTNWKACCPFHSENSPSFSISNSKGIYKCFGCGEGGDAISFLMNPKGLNLTFPEALEKVAAVSKLKVRYKEGVDRSTYLKEQNAIKERRASLAATMKLVADWYAANAPDLEPAPIDEYPNLETTVTPDGHLIKFTFHPDKVMVAGRAYLKSTVEKFGVFAPTVGLAKHAQENKWSLDVLKTLGVINQSENGPYDVYRGRFLFTLRSDRGEVVGLAGRLPKGDKSNAPKYINAPASELYDKSQTLFGFDVARKAIQSTETVYLVEGYTDAMTCHEYGCENVAATCGTALTDEHCALMKRYGVVNVVLFRDGDRAGFEAAKKDVAILVRNGLKPKVLLCHESHDPDSQVRELGEKGFKGFRESEQDAIIWRSMLEWSKTDPAKQAEAITTAAELLALLPENLDRTVYVKALCQNDRFGNNQKTLEQKIQSVLAGRNASDKKKKRYGQLESEEEMQGLAYGVFKDGNVIKRYDPNGEHSQITNFSINPLYFIKDHQTPALIIEIVNEHGHTAILNAPTDGFVTWGNFKMVLARQGNFRFEPRAKGIEFEMIMKLMNDELNNSQAYQIVAMGWHQKGFYTWCNGITDLKGDFYEVDQYGLVNFEGTKFLLPGFGVSMDENFDISEEDNAHVRAFRYYPGECVGFEEWNSLFMEVYGENGMIGTCFWLASLFRDLIFPKNKCFPLLNGFGKKGTGKSTMQWSLGYMFGDARTPGILGVSTYTAFYRSFAQISNAIVWWDEFHNKLDLKAWIKPMMGVWDGNGRSLGNITSTSGTSQTAIRAAFAYTGQDMPVNNDGALMSRSITYQTNYKRSPESDAKLTALRKIEQTGQLSQLTAKVITKREKVEKMWAITWDTVKNDLTDHLRSRMADMDKVESRTLINHLIPVVVFKILEDDFPFQFTYLDLIDFTARLVESQGELINSSDDTGNFWTTLEYLVGQSRLRHGRDILVEMQDSITKELGRTGKSEKVLFKDADDNPTEKRVIFLRIKDAHMAYAEQSQRLGKTALELSTLEHYLQTSKAFLGICRAKKFGGNPYRCYMFDAAHLDNVEFLLSVEVRSYKDGEGEYNPNSETEAALNSPVVTEWEKDANPKGLPF